MIGYYVDRQTKEVLRGNTRPERFYEYWLFIYEEGRWVLHEIRQKTRWISGSFRNKARGEERKIEG